LGEGEFEPVTSLKQQKVLVELQGSWHNITFISKEIKKTSLDIFYLGKWSLNFDTKKRIMSEALLFSSE